MTTEEATETTPETIKRETARSLRSIFIGLAIFLVALGLRFVHLSELVETEFFDERAFVVDARYYDMRATEIAGGDLYGDSPAYLSPTYCHALGLLYSLPGFDLEMAKYAQALLGAFSALLIYLIGRKLFGDLAGTLAGLTAATYGLFVYYSGVLLPATLLLFLHLLLLWVLVAKPLNPTRAMLVGVLLGLSIGTKANALLLLPVIAGWILLDKRVPKLSVRAGWIGALALGTLLSLSPITYGNWQTSGEFVLVSTTGGRNLLKGNGPTANGTHAELDLKRRTSTLGTYLAGKTHAVAAVREDRRLRDQAVEYMLDNPGHTIELWGKKLLLFFNRLELGIRDSYPFARTQTRLLGGPLLDFGLVIPFGLAGLLLLATRSRDTKLLALVTATQVASFVLVFVLARYRVVAVAMLVVFAGGFCADLIQSISKKNLRRIVAAAIALALSFGLVHYEIEGVPRKPTTGEQLEFLGERAAHREEYEQAIEYFEQASTANFALNQQDGRWRVQIRIGKCLVHLERPEEARKLWTVLYYGISDKKSKSAGEVREELRDRLAELDDPDN